MKEGESLSSSLDELNSQDIYRFPAPYGGLDVPADRGVYVIRNLNHEVEHVGRTVSGKNGLHQRLRNHIHGASSFVSQYKKKMAKDPSLEKG